MAPNDVMYYSTNHRMCLSFLTVISSLNPSIRKRVKTLEYYNVEHTTKGMNAYESFFVQHLFIS